MGEAANPELDELAKRVLRLEREDRTRRKWHSDPAIMISLAALIFSLTTTGFSYYQARQADIRAARTEVRQLAQRISVAPREAMDLQSRLAGDALQRQAVDGMIALEVSLVANQAREIMAGLPPGTVKATEQLTVGQALINNYRIEEGLELLDAAIAGADDLMTKTNAMRQRGYARFGLGQIEAGRADYRAALKEIETRAASYSKPVVLQNLVFTRLAWAGAEMTVGNAEEAGDLLAAARKDVEAMPGGQLRSYMTAQIAQAEGIVGVGQGTITLPEANLLPGG
jgi:hypothetical protein